MAAPTFVAGYAPSTGWNTRSGSQTVSVTCQAGDVLVLLAGTENGATNLNTPTGGTGISWTLQQRFNGNNAQAEIDVWTTIVPSNQTFTCSVANTGSGSLEWGYDVLRFSGSSGVGASSKVQTTGATTSVSLTTTQANSAVALINGDWNGAGTTNGATWLTVNGITPTIGNGLCRFDFVDGQYGIHDAYWSNTGSIGAYSFGMTEPASQKSSIVAVEILGTSAVATTAPAPWIAA